MELALADIWELGFGVFPMLLINKVVLYAWALNPAVPR